MANTGKTAVGGTLVEVRKQGTTGWEKFVCYDTVPEIDYGSKDESSDYCMETDSEDVTLGMKKYGDTTFPYTWTQALTNAADGIIKAAFDAANDADQIIEARTTMQNATGAEATGTTYITPYKVKGYKHKGEKGGKWTTETTWRQTGDPVETAAA